jgi:hypothetical protein
MILLFLSWRSWNPPSPKNVLGWGTLLIVFSEARAFAVRVFVRLGLAIIVAAQTTATAQARRLCLRGLDPSLCSAFRQRAPAPLTPANRLN